MRRLFVIGFAAVVTGACSDSGPSPAQPGAIALPLRVEQRGGTADRHSVHLSGDEEPSPVPPAPSPVDSDAQGQGIFKVADDELSFDYKLIAANIENVVQAHIHCGPAGVNGPIMIWLYPSVTSTSALTGPTGRHDGVLAEGTVISGEAGHVRTVAANHPVCTGGVANFTQALEKIRTGFAYVNVHTNDGVAPTNTGPGDFPGGEIRAQFGR